MKTRCLLLLFLSGLVLSCGTGPKPDVVGEPPVTSQQENVEGTNVPDPVEIPSVRVEEEKVFDPSSISEEVYSTAKADIQALIADLNRIIRARNYNSWIEYLDESYLNLISSREFLEEKTEELYKRDQIVAGNLGRDPAHVEKKILRTPRDYFNNVVVPSRSQDTLDDIAFVSETHVKAYTVDLRGQRLVLYEFETIGGKWKIVS